MNDNFLSSKEDIIDFFDSIPVTHATLRVTERCNLYCKHCYSNSCNMINPNTELSLNDLKKLLTQLNNKGVYKLSISGGEPFCRSDIYDILKFASDLKFEIYLSSNGTNICVDKLRNINIKVLQISIDGLNNMHDYIRGNTGTFNCAINLLKKLKEIDCISEVGVAFSLMKCNCEEIVPLLVYLLDNSLVDIFSVIPVQISGRASTADVLSANELKLIFEKLANCYIKWNNRFHLNLMVPPALIPPTLVNTRFGKGYICEFPYMIAIDSKGNCSFCDGLLNYPEQFINTDDQDYFEKMFSIDNSSIWLNEKPSDLEGICSNCIFLELCCGGCRVNSFAVYSSYNKSDPLCQSYFDAGIFPIQYQRSSFDND